MRPTAPRRFAAIALAVSALAATPLHAETLRWTCPGPGKTHFAVVVDTAVVDHVGVEEFHAGSTAPVRKFDLRGGALAHGASYEDDHMTFWHDLHKARLTVHPRTKPRNCGKPHELD